MITNTRIESIDVDAIRSELLTKKAPELDHYCVDRILRRSALVDPDNWEVTTCGGYYGEEVSGVAFTNPRELNKVQAALEKCLSYKTLAKRIKFVLEYEYGYLLDDLKKAKFTEDTVDKADLVFGQTQHYLILDKATVEEYRDYKLFRGVVIKDGKKYRIIDGYHRCAAAPENKKVKVIVATVKK